MEVSDGPDDATGHEVELGPGSFIVEGSASDEYDGAERTVRLLLFEGCAEAVAIGVTVHAKRASVVGNGVPVQSR